MNKKLLAPIGGVLVLALLIGGVVAISKMGGNKDSTKPAPSSSRSTGADFSKVSSVSVSTAKLSGYLTGIGFSDAKQSTSKITITKAANNDLAKYFSEVQPLGAFSGGSTTGENGKPYDSFAIAQYKFFSNQKNANPTVYVSAATDSQITNLNKTLASQGGVKNTKKLTTGSVNIKTENGKTAVATCEYTTTGATDNGKFISAAFTICMAPVGPDAIYFSSNRIVYANSVPSDTQSKLMSEVENAVKNLTITTN